MIIPSDTTNNHKHTFSYVLQPYFNFLEMLFYCLQFFTFCSIWFVAVAQF